MAHNLTETSTFTASVQVPDDGDTGFASSVETPFQALANRTTNLNARLATVEADGVTGPASATDNALARFDATTGKLIQDSSATLDDSGNAAGFANVTLSGEVSYDSAKTRTKYRTVFDGMVTAVSGTNVWAKVGTADYYQTPGAGTGLYLMHDLSWLPEGAVIEKIWALVDPGIARATGSNRMQVALWQAVYNGSVTNVSGDNSDDGTTSKQEILIDLTGSPYTVVSGTSPMLAIKSGATVDADRYHGMKVQWLDPGPRNY